MKLHSSPISPFARKVRALILETGQSDDIEIVETHGTALDPGTHPTALNPNSRIPVLERSDGPAIYDSRVICRYLDARVAGGLYPEEPRLWDTLVLEATADGIMEAALLMVYEARLRPAEVRFPDWVEAQWSKIANSARHVNAVWASHLRGRPDMGHIALCAALGYVDFRLGDRDWRAGNDGLADWYDEFSKRPAMAATAPG